MQTNYRPGEFLYRRAVYGPLRPLRRARRALTDALMLAAVGVAFGAGLWLLVDRWVS